jgi:hypothetical protein
MAHCVEHVRHRDERTGLGEGCGMRVVHEGRGSAPI